jgi:hypothetical protein
VLQLCEEFARKQEAFPNRENKNPYPVRISMQRGSNGCNLNLVKWYSVRPAILSVTQTTLAVRPKETSEIFNQNALLNSI